MSIFDKISLNDTKGEEYRLACSQCNGLTSHKVLTSVINYSKDDEDVQYWEIYEIVQCQGCKTISFRQNGRCSEEFSIDDDNKPQLVDHVQLYPPRVAGRQKLKDFWILNDPIDDIYIETHAALCNNLPILTSIGIRALIEVICNDKLAKGKNLEKRIDDLVVKGILTKNGADILHSLRIMGNQSAHEIKPAKQELLNIAFDVIENLLNSVYLIPLNAKKLPKRKKTP